MSRLPLPLLRLFLGILLPVLLVGVLAEEVLDGERYAFEAPLLLALHSHAGELLNRLAILFTDLGGVWIIAPASALLLVYFWFRRRSEALFFAVAVGGSALLTLALKVAFPRVRPALWPRLVDESDASFPSGHALYSLALVLALLLIFWHTPRFRWRWPALLLGLVFSLLVGVSRLYLGVHYPSDVLAGWLCALAWVLGSDWVLRRKRDGGRLWGTGEVPPNGPGGSLDLPGTAQ